MRRHAAVLLVALFGCGPGLEERPPPEARIEAGRNDARADRRFDKSTGWACVEYLATNYDHVAQGHATICGGDACALGSGNNLGFYNTAISTYVRETKKGYYELGKCP